MQKKTKLILAGLFMSSPFIVYAQTSTNVNLQDEVVVQPSAPASSLPQKIEPIKIQQQPVTEVEASPLSESRAEMLRKARRQTEVQTEQKIVEKLEASRLADEKKRAKKLYVNI